MVYTGYTGDPILDLPAGPFRPALAPGQKYLIWGKTDVQPIKLERKPGADWFPSDRKFLTANIGVILFLYGLKVIRNW